uniref:Uncharacterized protein LOC113794661 n=1 Tax=Dermatophagoides pteronyssinus TaxID=6956 RepID=A0A6P6Y535_DERPT|nr:uncharacterized protein LOC113794661 [Dermatophagoides pteronyssinus]
MDNEELYKKDIIHIINIIHQDLVGDGKLFLYYLPDSDWNKIFFKMIDKYPGIRDRFNRFNTKSGQTKDPLMVYLISKVRNNKSTINQREKRQRNRLTTTIEVAKSNEELKKN